MRFLSVTNLIVQGDLSFYWPISANVDKSRSGLDGLATMSALHTMVRDHTMHVGRRPASRLTVVQGVRMDTVTAKDFGLAHDEPHLWPN